MAITYKVVVQPIALRDMTDAVTYIADELKSPSAAERLSEKLVQGIESLAKLPTRCPTHRVSRPLKREYRQLRVDNYLVLFTVSEENETVTVAHVLYARRSLDKHLE
ncbi:MAG: type II toxin-antitoxin system RelE/ParE family toxin [Atopobiaceae bacterium]|nr:type II toxin-antitoxin system RelE/ParE family toxin [Atopobiaceae bacterium]